MRKTLFTVSFLWCYILVCVAQEDSYKIEGRLENSTGGQLLLVIDTEKGMMEIGDAVISNGAFEFTGRMPEGVVAYLMSAKKDEVLATIMLENARYTIRPSENGAVVEGGGAAQKIWNEFYALGVYLARTWQQLESEIRANPARVDKLRQEFTKTQKQVQAEERALLEKYSDTYVAAYVVASATEGIDEGNLAERYGLLGENAKNSVYGKQVAVLLGRMEKIAVGAVAPDFSVPLADGGVLSLHETRAKVKIVNFWVSGSEPCRQENVNLLKIYKYYRPKGLEIISVSMDDNKQAWLKALGEDGCNWKNVLDVKGQASEIAAEYCVKTIPCTFVLDGENRIVAKNLYGKDLEKKIAEMLKKK